MTSRNDKSKYEDIIERLDDQSSQSDNIWHHMISFQPRKSDGHDIQARILEFLEQNPSASASEMAALLGVDTRTIDMAVRRLVKWKAIETSTVKKVRYFRLKKRNGD